MPHDSLDPAAGAVVTTYTGSNVSPNRGTAVGSIRAPQRNVSAGGSGGAATPVAFDFGNLADKPVYLRSANEGSVPQFQRRSARPAGTVLNILVEWTERELEHLNRNGHIRCSSDDAARVPAAWPAVPIARSKARRCPIACPPTRSALVGATSALR